MTRATSTAAPLAPNELARLLEELAAQARAGIPWPDAIASPGRRGRRQVADAFEPMADQLRKGRDVDEVLSEIAGRYGPQVAAVVRAGAASGRPGEALSGMAGLIRRRLEYRRRLARALVYPLFVSGLALVLLVGGMAWIEHQGGGPWGLAPADWLAYWPVLAVGLAMLIVVALLSGPRIAGWLPPRIRVLRWARLAWFAELVALELEQGIPFGEAVELSAEASGDWGVRRAAATWRAAEQRGGALAPTSDVPRLLAWTLRYGADAPTGLPEALRRLAQIYWHRSEQASVVLASVVPAVLIVLVAGSLAVTFILLVLAPIYGQFGEVGI